MLRITKGEKYSKCLFSSHSVLIWRCDYTGMRTGFYKFPSILHFITWAMLRGNVVSLRLWHSVRCSLNYLAIFHIHSLQSSLWYSWTLTHSEWDQRPKEYPASMPQERGYRTFKRGKYIKWVNSVLLHLFIYPWGYCDRSGVGTSGRGKVFLQGFLGSEFLRQISALPDFLLWMADWWWYFLSAPSWWHKVVALRLDECF